jgi:uncharacterized membrane protein
MFAHPAPWALAALGWALMGLALVDAMRRARWQAELNEHRFWALATAAVLLGQRMGFTLPSGLVVHYLGAGFLVLLLGYPRALLSMTVVLFAGPWLVGTPGPPTAPSMLALKCLLAGWLPAWLAAQTVEVSKRLLPPDPFVFMLGCGLFGLALSGAASWLASTALHVATAPNPPADFLEVFLPHALLLSSGEAWLEAMVISALVVFRPHAVRLFDQHHYLPRR